MCTVGGGEVPCYRPLECNSFQVGEESLGSAAGPGRDRTDDLFRKAESAAQQKKITRKSGRRLK
jgi:hypothetical protein